MSDEVFDLADDEEVLDGLPVLADVRPVELVSTARVLPTVQATAAAVTGFVAGAATLAIVHRRQARKLASRQPGRAFDMLPSGGKRTFLVQVQRISRPGE